MSNEKFNYTSGVKLNRLTTLLFLPVWVHLYIHTVICSMRTALVASVSCRRLFICSILRVAVLSF